MSRHPGILRPVSWLLLSYALYSLLASPTLAVLLLAATLITFLAAHTRASKRAALRYGAYVIGVAANLALLIWAKGSSGGLWGSLGLSDSPLVPAVGVSYFTLQALGYLFDVRRGQIKAERSFLFFGLFLSFFPKLLQGPIERGKDLIPQLRIPWHFDYDRMRAGSLLILMGLFRKLIIADRLAVHVGHSFADPHSCCGVAVLAAAYGFGLQLYFDFTGYMDVARGFARLLGVELNKNFDRPYRARSISEFWRRWHISLSNWLRDFIFLPVAYSTGRRLASAMRSERLCDLLSYGLAALVTMLLCGLWHGIGLTFVVWGLAHGVMLALSPVTTRFWRTSWSRLRLGSRGTRSVVEWAVTFNLISLAWILFRSPSLSDASTMLTSLVRPGAPFGSLAGFGSVIFWLEIGLAALLAWAEPVGGSDGWIEHILSRPALVRWLAYAGLALALVFLGVLEGGAFVYLQF